MNDYKKHWRTMTPRMRQVAKYMTKLAKEDEFYSYPIVITTQKAMAVALGMPQTNVNSCVQALQERGLIRMVMPGLYEMLMLFCQ